MRRHLALIPALALFLGAPVAVAAPAPARPVPSRALIGLSDQTPVAFSSPLFAPLKMRSARYVAPWDVATGGDPAGKFDSWLAAALGAGVRPLISFEHSITDQCPDSPCTLPTDAQYASAFGAFRAKYPAITLISPWNEANHKTQPTYQDPLQAAAYYRIVKRMCAGCTIVAADVLDEPNMESWLKRFKALAGSARLYGLHNYADANRFRKDTKNTKTGITRMLKTVPGTIWLTETGAIVRFTTSKGLAALPQSESRATRSMRYLFDKLIPSSPRIKRVYIYNWGSDPANRFDAGLIGPDGLPRQTYEIVKAHAR